MNNIVVRATFVVGFLVLTSAVPAAAPDPVRIGMVQSLFMDVPAPIVQLLSKPFTDMVKEFTGLNGQVVAGGKVEDVAKNLYENKLHLAVLHGYELAWAQQWYPDLRPLMVVIGEHRRVQVYLVVSKDSKAAHVADLYGKKVALPRRSKEHCRMFLERYGAQCKVITPANAEVALDDVVLGKVQGVCVDIHALEMYKELKPGVYKRLRILHSSENFPPAAIVYRHGALDEETLDRFRTGMLNANTSDKARRIMGLFHIAAFEAVPNDYAQNLAEILKAYPPPPDPVNTKVPPQ